MKLNASNPASTHTIAEPHRKPPTSDEAATDSALLRIGAVTGITGVLLQVEPREQKRNKPWATKPHRTNQTHHYRAQNATVRAQWHGSELWSPVRDEEAAGSNPVTPTVLLQVTGLRAGMLRTLGAEKYSSRRTAADVLSPQVSPVAVLEGLGHWRSLFACRHRAGTCRGVGRHAAEQWLAVSGFARAVASADKIVVRAHEGPGHISDVLWTCPHS